MIIWNEVMLILRIFHITIGWITSCKFAVNRFGMKSGTDFSAAILCIPLIDDIFKRSKLVIAAIGINIVVNSNEACLIFRENNFDEVSRLQIISSQTGQILYADR